MNSITNVSIGSDVEYFLRNKKSGQIISAEGLIKGTKYEPFRFDKKSPFYATSLDNVLAEGNIPPAYSSMQFIEYLGTLRSFIDKTVGDEVETIAMASARLDDKFLQTDTAREFGCDPSFNCWTGEIIQPVPSGDNLRSAGFHIHVGYKNPKEEQNLSIARAMDLYLGVPSIVLEPENERKTVGYGCAGNFRHQLHGIEYRVLSSYFASNPKLIEWAFNNTHEAIKILNAGKIDKIHEAGAIIMETIDGNNKGLATELIKEFSIPVNV